tara:strand:- start:523 stop:732 length:210 start_codon:yes stop_codon:yes gene_type:complete
MDELTFYMTYRTLKTDGYILSPEQVSNLLEDKNLSVTQLNQVEQLYNKNYTSVFNYLKSLTQLSEIKIE